MCVGGRPEITVRPPYGAELTDRRTSGGDRNVVEGALCAFQKRGDLGVQTVFTTRPSNTPTTVTCCVPTVKFDENSRQ